MTEQPKQNIELSADQFAVDTNGNLLINNSEFHDLVKSSGVVEDQMTEDGAIGVGVIIVVN